VVRVHPVALSGRLSAGDLHGPGRMGGRGRGVKVGTAPAAPRGDIPVAQKPSRSRTRITVTRCGRSTRWMTSRLLTPLGTP
jgi:hypothetical protein